LSLSNFEKAENGLDSHNVMAGCRREILSHLDKFLPNFVKKPGGVTVTHLTEQDNGIEKSVSLRNC
jgi:hypothetical protein